MKRLVRRQRKNKTHNSLEDKEIAAKREKQDKEM